MADHSGVSTVVDDWSGLISQDSQPRAELLSRHGPDSGGQGGHHRTACHSSRDTSAAVRVRLGLATNQAK